MSAIDIIDIEASGLHFASYPIEVALLLQGVVHTWLIAPEPNWQHWDKNAESLHGISRAELEKSGKQVHVVASEINYLLQKAGGVIYSDADDWDFDWIRKLFEAAKMPMRIRLASIYGLLDAEQITVFEDSKKYLVDKGRFRQHRAGEDVQLIYKAYQMAIEY